MLRLSTQYPSFRLPGPYASALADSLFADPQTHRAMRSYSPPIDIFERNGDLFLRADLPGVDPSAVQLEVEGHQLFLRGERPVEAGEGDMYSRRERSLGEFTRTFSLPSTVDVNAIEANFRHGVLEVRLPRLQQAKPRQIAVQ